MKKGHPFRWPQLVLQRVYLASILRRNKNASPNKPSIPDIVPAPPDSTLIVVVTTFVLTAETVSLETSSSGT